MNWAGNVAFSAERVVQPETVAHAQELIAGADHVRIVGSRHSFSRIADGHLMLDATSLPEQFTLASNRATVRVNGGMTYGRLSELLAPLGLTLSNFASLPHISIAGAVATGTHGSGFGNQNLGAAVKAVQFVSASGELVELAAGNDGYDGAVVSLGALGLIAEITLEVTPMFEVAQTVYDGIAMADAAANIDVLMRSAYSVSVFTTWQDGEEIDEHNQIWVKRRVGDESPVASESFLSGLSEADSGRHPIKGLDASACTTQFGEPGAPVDRLPHFKLDFTPSNGDEIQSEFFVPWTDAAAAIRAVDAIGSDIRDALLIGEVRTVASDDQWMSPHYGRNSLAFHFTWHRNQALAEDAARRVAAALLPFAVRPHWGKVFDLRQFESGLLPRHTDFLDLVDQFDATGKFSNDWFETVIRGSGMC